MLRRALDRADELSDLSDRLGYAVQLDAPEETKTRSALDYFSKQLAEPAPSDAGYPAASTSRRSTIARSRA